jgi:hypothetical protein
MTPGQRDIRFFYWRLGQEPGAPKPDSADAQAFAERVAIIMESCGLSEHDAREEAVKPYLDKKREVICKDLEPVLRGLKGLI